MRKTALMVGAIIVGVLATAAQASMQRANVDPYRGHRHTEFTVSVRVPEPAIRSGSVQRTYEVEATGPTWKHGCVSSDSVPVDSASANQLVKVTLSARPHRWCRGWYDGQVLEMTTPVCQPGRMCPMFLEPAPQTIAEFRFHVR